jgi:hypothetical protein
VVDVAGGVGTRRAVNHPLGINSKKVLPEFSLLYFFVWDERAGVFASDDPQNRRLPASCKRTYGEGIITILLTQILHKQKRSNPHSLRNRCHPPLVIITVTGGLTELPRRTASKSLSRRREAEIHLDRAGPRKRTSRRLLPAGCSIPPTDITSPLPRPLIEPLRFRSGKYLRASAAVPLVNSFPSTASS